MGLMRNLAATYGLLLMGFGSGALVTVVLGNLLPAEELGRFILVRASAETLLCLAPLGMDSALLKFFAARDLGQYAWPPLFRRTLGLCLAVTALAALAALAGWGLAPGQAACLLFCGWCGSAVSLSCVLLRSQERYVFAALLGNLSPLLFALLLLPGLAGVWQVGLGSALLQYAAAFGLAAGLGLFGLARLAAPGRACLPAGLRKNAWVFLAMGLTTLVVDRAGTFAVPSLLSMSDLATYGLLLGLSSPFGLARSSLQQVLATHLAREKQLRLLKHFLLTAGAGGALALGFWLAGPWLLHLLFAGKYDAGASLFPWLACAGFFIVLSALPSALVGGRSHESLLGGYAWATGLSCVLGLGLLLLMGWRWGLAGVAAGRALSWAGQFACGLWASWLRRPAPRSAAASLPLASPRKEPADASV